MSGLVQVSNVQAYAAANFTMCVLGMVSLFSFSQLFCGITQFSRLCSSLHTHRQNGAVGEILQFSEQQKFDWSPCLQNCFGELKGSKKRDARNWLDGIVEWGGRYKK